VNALEDPNDGSNSLPLGINVRKSLAMKEGVGGGAGDFSNGNRERRRRRKTRRSILDRRSALSSTMGKDLLQEMRELGEKRDRVRLLVSRTFRFRVPLASSLTLRVVGNSGHRIHSNSKICAKTKMPLALLENAKIVLCDFQNLQKICP